MARGLRFVKWQYITGGQPLSMRKFLIDSTQKEGEGKNVRDSTASPASLLRRKRVRGSNTVQCLGMQYPAQ